MAVPAWALDSKAGASTASEAAIKNVERRVQGLGRALQIKQAQPQLADGRAAGVRSLVSASVLLDRTRPSLRW